MCMLGLSGSRRQPLYLTLGSERGVLGLFDLRNLLEYFQTLFKARFKDRLLYETGAEYVKLFLPWDVAEKISKLTRLHAYPERERGE